MGSTDAEIAGKLELWGTLGIRISLLSSFHRVGNDILESCPEPHNKVIIGTKAIPWSLDVYLALFCD